MATPLLQSRVLYGLKTDVISNAHYITDNDILYPVGNALAIHNFHERRQRLLRLPEKYQINIIAVTPNKKYVAMCEVGDKPIISIYDVHSLRRRKTLGIPYDCPEVKKFTCVAFSFDNKYLAGVTDLPDQTMLFYAWEKGKVESSIKVINPQNPSALISQISCNPGDIGLVALAGRFSFKFLTCSETIWRPYGFSKTDNLLISSICWLNNDRLLAGTDDGRILFLENGDLKSIFKMSDVTQINLKVREEFVIYPSTEKSGEEIQGLVSFPKGFAFGYGPGRVLVFEKDGQHKFINKHIFTVPRQVTKDPDSTKSFYDINSISANPSSDRLIVTTGWSQLFVAKLWTSALLLDVTSEDLGIMGQALHQGPINSLSMCAWKSIFITSGDDDRSVRIWDYESENVVMFKQYQENIYSVALHPIGLFCLIGFTDKLRFMTISIDDLLTMQEFPIRACKIVKFSNGGNFFAAVNANIIHVYTTIDFSSKFLLKGHTGKISHIVWSQHDFKLISAGLDGGIYTWDMTTGTRIGEIILKNVSINGVGLTADASSIYCIVNHEINKIYEIKEDAIVRELSMTKNQLTSLLLGKNDSLIFATCPGGVILSFKIPLLEALECKDVHIHCTDITNFSLSFNEQNLISAGSDGSLCFWKVVSPEATPDSDYMYTSEVLIGKNDLGEKIQLIEELTIRIKELETEAAYKMRQIEVQHNDKMRQVHQGYCEAIEELKAKIDKLHEERTNELNNINFEIAKMKYEHEKSVKDMEIRYDSKLIVEYDKYSAFEVKNNLMRESYKRKIEKIEAARVKELEETIKTHEALLHEKGIQLQEFHEEMSHQVRIHERIKDQIEDDADREIVEIRSGYESLLYEERQANLKLKGEAGVLRNKYTANQKEIEDLKRNVSHLQDEQHQYQKTIEQLEKDVRDLKGEISERDAAIQDKEKSIYDLKRNNQELEKYKFVLNYKIVELKNQIEPKDDEIMELKDKVLRMEKEMLTIHNENKNLQLQISDMSDKLSGVKKEVQIEAEKNRNNQQLMKRIQKDLVDTAGVIQEPHALKVAVMNLYNRYSSDEKLQRTREASLEVECELIRQRDHLERTIDSLKRQFSRMKKTT
ncbi:cilia- and flagella-associated protein 57 [Fopius arisanus]|uniref:Cilia- and flagella-associated protein 57 n=1 Tax=Fopius arisanus TaxID=64838 RepID=A0A0C9RK59_9HYME|nr:PREDICTED: cilia- and flagella-associated protein 57 [Fopius arisanus]